MASEEESELFKEFVHALRSSCFQVIDFQDHVSVSGFLAVGVDGRNHQQFVISEYISRGDDNARNSFPLKILDSGKASGNLSYSDESQYGSMSRDPTRKSAKRSHTPPTKIGKDNGETPHQPQPPTRRPTTPKETSSRHVDSEPLRPFLFPKARTDASNLTFTMDPGTRILRSNQAILPSETTTIKSISQTTVDLSPSKSLMQRHDISSTSCSSHSPNNKSKLKKHQRIATSKGCDNKTTPCPRKRAHESTAQQPKQGIDAKPRNNSTLSSTSNVGNDHNPWFYEYLKRKQNRKDRYKHDPTERKEEVTQHPTRTQSVNNDPPLVKSSENCIFNPFWYDSEEECSITSVKPYYLVGHTDDVSMVTSDITEKSKVKNIVSHSEIPSNQLLKDDEMMSTIPLQLKNPSSASYFDNRDEMDATNQIISETRHAIKNDKDITSQKSYHQQYKMTDGFNAQKKFNNSFHAADQIKMDAEIKNIKSVQALPTPRTHALRVVDLPRFGDSFDDTYDIHSPKRKRKFTKLVQYFRKGIGYSGT